MRTEVIKADSIDAAAERILDELKEDDATTARSISSRNNVIYFDGWDGLGASAVLRAVAQRLTVASSEAPAGLQFDQIIHIDCAKWESRRALQREIAEQLKLPAHVMDMFDTQDAEDDYNGVAKESRAEIPQIVREMYGHVTKVLLIFHNGSDEEINMASFCGFPLSGYSTNKMLWTFQGRFRMCPRIKVVRAFNKSTAQGAATDVFLSAVTERESQVSYLVLQEAADLVAAVAAGKNNNGHGVVGSGGIIQIQLQQGHSDVGSDEDDDVPWRAADNLQREMQLDVEYWRHNLESLPSCLVRCGDRIASMPYWTSPPYEVLLSPLGDMFQQFGQLGVLKLSHCTFSFSSPPFLSSKNLRILWLDHCEDQVINNDRDPEKEDDICRLFQRLWVLDVCYSCCHRILSAQMIGLMTQLRELNVVGAHDWDIGQLQGRLPNIRRLRVTKSTVRCSDHSEQDLFQGKNKMELLDFSGNRTTHGVAEFSGISSSNNCLETMMITDGAVGLQNISFRQCARLKNVLLSGLFEDIRILDLSGTTVKRVDLSAMIVRSLNELFLDYCHKLCAILWPPEDKRKSNLKKLHIDTTWSAASSTPMKENSTEGSTTASITTQSSSASLSVVHGGRAPSEFDWCIRVRDARLLKSLVPFKQYFVEKVLVHVEIYSSAAAFSSGNDNKAVSCNSSIKQQHVLVKVDKPVDSLVYADVEVTFIDHPLPQASEGDAPMLTLIWPCPSIASPSTLTCYTHIQDHELSTKSLLQGEQTMTSIVIPDMICRNAYILHVHDSLSITSIPGPAPTLGSTWNFLNWCRIERCPKLEHVFTAPQLQARGHVEVFKYVQTFWASELSKARYIWNWTSASVFQFQPNSFGYLRLLHMDLCPRLIHVLPLALPMMVDRSTLGQLETLEIVWCADMREVFPLYTTDAKSGQQPQQSATTMVHFQLLKHIHLHEVPKLQGICGQWRISAPRLETVKIRGCWSLKRLPAVSNNTSKKVECDCEKEWWDTLEWDGLDANHHPSLYKATHSWYYKKTLLKGSVLR